MEQQLKKHSACDECRARKLKCSGNPSGCERCHKDKATCVYSTQKPMGRPRKRRRGNEEVEDKEVQYPSNTPAELSVVEVPHSMNQMFPHADQNNSVTGHFIGQFEWLNHESFDPFGLFDLEVPSSGSVLGISGGPEQNRQQHRTPALTLRTGGPSPFSLRDTPVETHPSNDTIAAYFPGLEDKPLPTSCSCLASFFTSISALRVPPPAHSISLPYTLQTSSTALQAVQGTFACESCHVNVQASYITNMLLGIQLPLLCQFYHRVLASIEATTDPQYVVMGDGQAMQLDAEQWKIMARTAIRKEAMKVLDIVRELEGMAARLHGVPVAKIGNLTDHKGNQPLCIRILKIIKAVAEFIAIQEK